MTAVESTPTRHRCATITARRTAMNSCRHATSFPTMARLRAQQERHRVSPKPTWPVRQQRKCARARVVDEPSFHHCARDTDADQRGDARRGGIRRRADRRCSRHRQRERPRRSEAASGTRTHPGFDRGRAREHHCRRTTRHVAVPVAAARAARTSRQRHDSRKGAGGRSTPVRGLGIPRQTHTCPGRGIDSPALARGPHVRLGTERRFARQLRPADRAIFAMGPAVARFCRLSRVHRRNEILGRGVPPVPVAFAGDANADVSRVCHRAR